MLKRRVYLILYKKLGDIDPQSRRINNNTQYEKTKFDRFTC
ncbi:hypothetical protein HNP99_002186 [Flavobacterium sp. 28A]|nr:hypothetical protein [Flavobacterium sp. 28A]